MHDLVFTLLSWIGDKKLDAQIPNLVANFNLILCLLHFLDVGFFQSHEPWDTRAHSLIRTASQTYDFRVSAGN